jgi:hypothetical protein
MSNECEDLKGRIEDQRRLLRRTPSSDKEPPRDGPCDGTPNPGEGGRSGEEYRDAFLGRFDALVRAHELGFSENGGIGLNELVERALEPYAANPAAVVIEPGPAVALASGQLLPLSLILHDGRQIIYVGHLCWLPMLVRQGLDRARPYLDNAHRFPPAFFRSRN